MEYSNSFDSLTGLIAVPAVSLTLSVFRSIFTFRPPSLLKVRQHSCKCSGCTCCTDRHCGTRCICSLLTPLLSPRLFQRRQSQPMRWWRCFPVRNCRCTARRTTSVTRSVSLSAPTLRYAHLFQYVMSQQYWATYESNYVIGLCFVGVLRI